MGDFFFARIFIFILIVGASYFLARQNPDVEKLSPYECGFEPYENARHIFDVNFCVIANLGTNIKLYVSKDQIVFIELSNAYKTKFENNTRYFNSRRDYVIFVTICDRHCDISKIHYY